MNIKQIINTVLALLGLILLNSCSPKIYNSMKFQSVPITVDGKADEWDNPLRYYEKNSKLSYEVKNDNKNLYIAFRANEASTIMRIMRSGISLSIDTAMGRNDYPLSITFPFHGNKPPMMAKGELPPIQQGEDFQHKERPMMKADIKLCGFNNKASDTISSKGNSLGIEADIQGDMNSIFCELKIPFASFYKTHLTTNDSLKAFFFEVNLATLNRSDMPMLPRGTPDDENSPPRGMGGPPSGGGMPRGNMGGMGGGMPSGFPPGGGGMGKPNGGGGMPPMPSDNEGQMTPNIFRFELRPRVN